MEQNQDVLDRLRRYAPTPTSVAPEWNLQRDAAVLELIHAEAADGADVIPLRFLAPASTRRRMRTRLLPVAASVAVLALAAGVLVTVLPEDGSPAGGGSAGLPFDPPAGLSDRADVGAGQFSLRVTEQIRLDAQGRPDSTSGYAMTMTDYVAPDGTIVSRRTGAQTGCHTYAAGNDGSLAQPTRQFLATLPTDVTELNDYLRAHVEGSSSHDEAVFVSVGDTLRDYDGLASPRLRAAMVGVLSRTPGVAVHPDERDYLGRAAVRVDFVDQRIRPGEVSSLYFDPTEFRLLEERSGSSGAPTEYTGPSPAYDGHGQVGAAPEQLSYPASISLMRTEQVVDTAPAC